MTITASKMRVHVFLCRVYMSYYVNARRAQTSTGPTACAQHTARHYFPLTPHVTQIAYLTCVYRQRADGQAPDTIWQNSTLGHSPGTLPSPVVLLCVCVRVQAYCLHPCYWRRLSTLCLPGLCTDVHTG